MQKFIFHHKQPFDANLIIPVENTNFQKPLRGGLWLSTYCQETKQSKWKTYVENERVGCKEGYFKYGYEITLCPKARIFTIDCLGDFCAAMNFYAQSYKYLGSPQFLDFEDIAKDYDAVFLTEKGKEETMWSKPFDLYSWSIESILVLDKSIIADVKAIKSRKLVPYQPLPNYQ